MGAELVEFSLLADAAVVADAIYLSGGYPKLHLKRLEGNRAIKASIHAHARAGRPIYGECGGMFYLLDSPLDRDGERGAMLGLLPGEGRLMPRLVGLGLESIALPGEKSAGTAFIIQPSRAR